MFLAGFLYALIFWRVGSRGGLSALVSVHPGRSFFCVRMKKPRNWVVAGFFVWLW